MALITNTRNWCKRIPVVRFLDFFLITC